MMGGGSLSPLLLFLADSVPNTLNAVSKSSHRAEMGAWNFSKLHCD